jgi:uncharacterized phiE125 gp8 family phage protein
MGLQLVTPPTELPVSLSMAKRHCRVDHNDDDSVIDIYIGSATKTLDGKDGTLGRCLMPQTWDLYWDAFPCGALEIPGRLCERRPGRHQTCHSVDGGQCR